MARAFGSSPSGVNFICWGVRANTRSARIHIVAAITTPIAAAAIENPTALIAAAQSGEKTTPPRLPPL
jgi:hypothetical protein